MEYMRRLCDIEPGDAGIIADVPETMVSRRLEELGFIKGTVVRCVGKSLWGDPCAYAVRGAVIALRRCDSAGIAVSEAVTAWD